MDSVTRLAMAQREIGLAARRTAQSKRLYTPSVFTLPARRIFRSAPEALKPDRSPGFSPCWLEGDDFNEPICDAARGILDGHPDSLAGFGGLAGHYPAIDVLNSVSRLANKINSKEEVQAAQKVRESLAIYQQSSDLIQLWRARSAARIQSSIRAFAFCPHMILDYLRQDANAHVSLEDETRRPAC